MNLDRNALLSIIREDHRQHADVAESTHSNLVSAATARVGRRLLEHVDVDEEPDLDALRRPVPMEAVARFMEGSLPDDQAIQLCERAAFDDELLGELILMVSSEDDAVVAPPLSEDLRHRLLSMKPVSRTELREPLVQRKARSRRKRPIWAIGIAAVAAGIMLAAVWFRGRQETLRPEGSQNEIAESEKPTIVGPRAIQPPTRSVVEDPSDATAPRPSPMIEIDLPSESKDLLVVDETSPKTSDASSDNLAVTAPVNRPVEMAEPLRPEPQRPVAMGTVQWNSISGVLVQGGMETADESSRSNRARAVAEADRPMSLDQSVVLRTLPLSRAEATRTDGGRLVLSADTLVRVRRNGSLDVQSGAVAMVGWPVASRLGLSAQKQTQTIEVVEDADWIVRRDAAGVAWVDVYRGQLKLGDRLIRDESIALDDGKPNGTGADANVDKPERLPRWVERPVDKIQVPRTFLAQIERSDDLADTLQDQIRQLSVQASSRPLSNDQQMALMTLATWYASLDERQLFRLAGWDNVVVRRAALMRLVSLLPTDSRHGLAWRAVPRDISTPAELQGIRGVFTAVWRQRFAGRPVSLTAKQVNDLIGWLQSGRVSIRSTADFLLRLNFGGGPRFDPHWTGTSQTRGIALWRSWVSQR